MTDTCEGRNVSGVFHCIPKGRRCLTEQARDQDPLGQEGAERNEADLRAFEALQVRYMQVLGAAVTGMQHGQGTQDIVRFHACERTVQNRRSQTEVSVCIGSACGAFSAHMTGWQAHGYQCDAVYGGVCDHVRYRRIYSATAQEEEDIGAMLRSQNAHAIRQWVRDVVSFFQGRVVRWCVPPHRRCAILDPVLRQEGFTVTHREEAMVWHGALCDPWQEGDVGSGADSDAHAGVARGARPTENLGWTVECVQGRNSLADFADVLRWEDRAASVIYRHLDLDLLAKEGIHLFLGKAWGMPVTITIVCVHQSDAGIFHLLTRPESRRCGYGAAMMTAVLQWLRQRKVARVSLAAAHPGAVRLYGSLGFMCLGVAESFSGSLGK